MMQKQRDEAAAKAGDKARSMNQIPNTPRITGGRM